VASVGYWREVGPTSLTQPGPCSVIPPEGPGPSTLFPREPTDFRSWIERSTMPILRAAARSAISSIRIFILIEKMKLQQVRVIPP